METRDFRLARLSHFGSIRVHHTGKIVVSFMAETTPLRIVSHCGGNPFTRELNSCCPKSCLLDAYPPNMLQRFARRGKIARLRQIGRHPTVLHTSPRERTTVDVRLGTEDVVSTQACSYILKTGTSANSGTSGTSRKMGMTVIPE